MSRKTINVKTVKNRDLLPKKTSNLELLQIHNKSSFDAMEINRTGIEGLNVSLDIR